jgi:hypothetical protein
MTTMTYKIVQEQLRKAGIVMSKRGCIHRINFFGGLEDTAYYTESLEHALDKGLQMARPRRTSSGIGMVAFPGNR